ncbi:MAG: TrpR YerC/YecD [Lachnospiraceae bacterium]|nr:TrpR YerC/YecD [Lachnospiraceae bacterium]
MSKNLHGKEMDKLMDGILTLRTREEVYKFFEDLCTVNELESINQRFQVAGMLREEKTYMDIAKETGASTATISRVNRALNYGNDAYDMVLNRLAEDKE